MENPYQTPAENSRHLFEPVAIDLARVQKALRWLKLSTVAFSISYISSIFFIRPATSISNGPNRIYDVALIFNVSTYLLGLGISILGLVRLLSGLHKSQAIMLLQIPLLMFPLVNIITLIHWDGFAKTALETHGLEMQLREQQAELQNQREMNSRG